MRAFQGSRSATSPYIDPAVAVGNKTGARARYPRNLTLSLPFRAQRRFYVAFVARFIDRFRKNDLTPIEEQQFHFFLSYELRNEFLCYVTKVKQFSGKKIISLTFITSRYNCTYLKVTINKTKQNSYIFKRVYEMISCPSYIRGIITSNPSNRKGGGGSGDAKARLKTCAGRCPPPLLYRLEIPASHA